MNRIVIASVIGLACVAGGANAQGAGPAEIIRARQAAMMLSGATAGAIKSALDAGQAPSTQRFPARALARWAHALPGMFPQGSGAEAAVRTGAKPEVWSDRAAFDAEAAKFAAAADRLAELAEGQDAAAFAEQLTVVRDGCQSCHDGYKS